MSENLSFNQINEQQSAAYRRGEPVAPTVLIEHGDGTIQPGLLNMETRDVDFIDQRDSEPKFYPSVSLDKLSDEHQQKLATALAGAALKDSETGSVLDFQIPETTGSKSKIVKPAKYDSNGVMTSIPEWDTDN